MTEEKTPQKKYAAVGNPTINAVLKSLYRFETEAQALDRIGQLKEHFVTSKHTAPGQTPNAAIIWVRGYELTEQEQKGGYTGNYAHISCKADGGKFTLHAVKLESDLRYHPQRKRPKKKHPDWGHPILRDIKKKRVFDSIEQAAKELQRLHEEFPEVSIPDETRLMIILYEKVEGVKSPVQKYKFEVKPIPQGGVFIDYRRNNKTKKSPPTTVQNTENTGYFTSMVNLKRKRKLPKPAE